MNLKAFFIVLATLLAVPSYFAGLYLFTDVSRLNKEYPVWEKIEAPWYVKLLPSLAKYSEDSHPYKIKWVKTRPSHWTSLSEIPKRTRLSFLTSEDSKFYSHHGFDWESIQKVIEKYRKSGKKGRLAGASTISQQVVKNVFLDNERSWWRKIRETLLTIKMEDSVKKDKILEVYFNIAEMGEDIHGIKAASQYYFNKSPRNLSFRESVFIASLLPNPKVYSRSYRMKRLSPYMSKRMRLLLHMMYRAHMMDVGTYVAEVGGRLSWERVATMRPVDASEMSRPENQTEVDLDEAEKSLEEDLELSAQESDAVEKENSLEIQKTLPLNQEENKPLEEKTPEAAGGPAINDEVADELKKIEENTQTNTIDKANESKSKEPQDPLAPTAPSL